MKKQILIGIFIALFAIISMISAFADSSGGSFVPLTTATFDFAQHFTNGYAFVVKNNTAGYLDINGSFIECYKISDEMLDDMRWGDNIFDITLEVSPEGLYTFYDSSKDAWGVKNIKTGETIIPARADGAIICKEGRIVDVDYDDSYEGEGYRTTVYDTTGKKLFVIEDVARNYYNDYGLLDTLHSGLYDLNGKMVIPSSGGNMGFMGAPIYCTYFADWDGYTFYDGGMFLSYENSWNDAGDADTIFNYYSTADLSKPLFSGKQSEGYGYIPKLGYVVFKNPSTGLLGIRKLDGKDNPVTVDAAYEEIKILNAKLAGVAKNGKYGFINPENGAIIIDIKYDSWYASSSSEVNLFCMGKDGKYGLYNTDGKMLLSHEYEYLCPWTNDILRYITGSEQYLLTASGSKLFKFPDEFDCYGFNSTSKTLLFGAKEKTIADETELDIEVPSYYTFYIYSEKPLVEDNRIILTIDSKDVSALGVIKRNDVAPIIVNDRTLLPVRFISENLGAAVDWNAEQSKATISKDGTEIVLYIDSTTAYINGKAVTLDSPAIIRSDRTYTPVRFIAEALGAKVDWDATTSQAIITK